jgi:hypothetical protein
MKRALMLILFFAAALSFAQDVRPSGASDVIHVSTALNHLTVLEFGEAVTMAAAGSSAFEIERQENKVFVKPLKPGVSTDLFVWTPSRRFAYELEPAGEVNKMNFAIDSPAPAPRPVPDPREQMTQVADTLLTKALLGAEQIDSRRIRDVKNGVTVRVEQVYETRNTVYIHYSILNSTRQPYRVLKPTLFQLVPSAPEISMASLADTQLTQRVVSKLGEAKRIPLEIATSETQSQDLAPRAQTRGVIAIRQQFSSPAVFELVFANAGDHSVTAVFIR